MAESRTVRLRILVRDVNPGPKGRFGLQDRDGALVEGDPADGGRWFEFQAKARPDGGRARLTGPWVHGPASDRFAYVSWRGEDGDWTHRLKIPLDIAWSDVEAAGDGVLEAEARSAGSPRAEIDRSWTAASG